MESRCSGVLDASAILALLNSEPGSDALLQWIPRSAVSTVNLCEVTSKLSERGLPLSEIRSDLEAIGFLVLPFDSATAYLAGELRKPTIAYGLSLGDRACLATALLQGVPAITADHVWLEIDVGVDVRVVR